MDVTKVLVIDDDKAFRDLARRMRGSEKTVLAGAISILDRQRHPGPGSRVIAKQEKE